MGYILLLLNVSLTFSTQIRFLSCLKLMSTWRRKTDLSLTYPWTVVFKGKKINKKREKIKRCRILHNPPVVLFVAASVLYSANESHQRAASSPTTHVLSSEETRAARCLFTFFFPARLGTDEPQQEHGSPKTSVVHMFDSDQLT